MHSAIIVKVEYRLPTEENFSTIEMIPQSGVFNEEEDTTSQGPLNKISLQFDIAGISLDSEILVKKLKGQKLQFRCTDSNSLVHLFGDDYYCARLKYSKMIDRTAGTFNGYRFTVTCNSPSGSSVS